MVTCEHWDSGLGGRGAQRLQAWWLPSCLGSARGVWHSLAALLQQAWGPQRGPLVASVVLVWKITSEQRFIVDYSGLSPSRGLVGVAGVTLWPSFLTWLCASVTCSPAPGVLVLAQSIVPFCCGVIAGLRRGSCLGRAHPAPSRAAREAPALSWRSCSGDQVPGTRIQGSVSSLAVGRASPLEPGAGVEKLWTVRELAGLAWTPGASAPRGQELPQAWGTTSCVTEQGSQPTSSVKGVTLRFCGCKPRCALSCLPGEQMNVPFSSPVLPPLQQAILQARRGQMWIREQLRAGRQQLAEPLEGGHGDASQSSWRFPAGLVEGGQEPSGC